ncbi:MAG: methionine adenosyltransferase [Clostridia bacterium]|nr:methionine adenosyltransferase [Clostridia bacterium]
MNKNFKQVNDFDKDEKVRKISTSESVNIGHPDKTCDVIADAFLDAALADDPRSQMAVECAIKNDKLFIYGEATTKAKIDYEDIARGILKEIGYQNDFKIIKEISQQSAEINSAVIKEELCANDQGIVYGYATNETPELMPIPIMIAHSLMRQYEQFRKGGDCFFADAKSQVSVLYENEVPKEISCVIVSVSHSEKLSLSEVQKQIFENVVEPVLQKYQHLSGKKAKILINPSGKFTIWGSFGDSGCVGRKIIVDTYGGVGRVGGGCFSSKNATKVDRSGAYYARYVAKNIVAKGLADRCEIQLGFSIGLSKPVSINIDCFGTNKKPIEEIYAYVKENFNFKLDNIIVELDLLKPIFKQTACYGHFGWEEFSWERIK